MPSGSTLSPLAHRMFLLLWLSSLTGNFGHAVHAVGASWLMTGLTDRADLVGLVHTAASLPVMLLALVGGAVADMFDRRRVMIASLSLIGASSLLLSVLTFQGWVSPLLLIVMTFAVGVGVAFYNPAAQASVGRVIPRDELAGAVSLNILGFNVARTVGPAVGGGLVALGGAIAAFFGHALACFTAAAMLVAWRPPPETPPETGRIIAAMMEGLRSVRDTPQLRAIALRAFAFTVSGSALWALMPLVVRDLLGGGPEQFGLLLGALGLGAVSGAAISHEVRRRYSGESILRAAGLVFGVACLVLALQPGFWVSFVVLIIGGAGWVQALSGFNVAGQLWARRPVVGRVVAAVSSMIYAGLAAGSWAWGYVAELTGVAPAIALSGGAMIVVANLGLLLPFPRRQDAPHG